MAHIDRQPSDEIFRDLQLAAYSVWANSDYHDEYVAEQIDHVEHIRNYADNWYSILGRMDDSNQMKLLYFVKRKDTIKFLQEQHVHYGYIKPRELT